MIACSFKSLLQQDRKAIKDINILIGKSKFEMKKHILEQYKLGLRENLITHAKDLVKVIEEDCLPVTGSILAFVFFLKLEADIYRYMVEVSVASEAQTYREKAEAAYKDASYLYERLNNSRIQ